MVSDSELISHLQEFLRNSDLNTTTTAIVRRHLENEFAVDLSDKKPFIREQVDLFLQSQFENAQEEENHENDVVADADEEEDDRTGKVKSEQTDEEDDDDDEEEGVDDDSGKRKKRSKKLNNETKKRGGGFCKLCRLSPQLQEFVGVPELARTEVVKQMWNYIREKDLQDPNNRRNIICDDRLRALFGVDSINMFQMNKALSMHIWPLDSDGGVTKSAPKEKLPKQEQEGGVTVKLAPKEKRRKQEREDPEEAAKKEKRQKSGFLAPLQLSDALVKFLGTGESVLSRSDVIKRIWNYIKENNLQDPSDKRTILCDDKLKELFAVDSFHGFTVTKLLSTHFVKT